MTMTMMRMMVSLKAKDHQQIETENVWTNFLSQPTPQSEYISFCRTNPPKQSQPSTHKNESECGNESES